MTERQLTIEEHLYWRFQGQPKNRHDWADIAAAIGRVSLGRRVARYRTAVLNFAPCGDVYCTRHNRIGRILIGPQYDGAAATIDDDLWWMKVYFDTPVRVRRGTFADTMSTADKYSLEEWGQLIELRQPYMFRLPVLPGDVFERCARPEDALTREVRRIEPHVTRLNIGGRKFNLTTNKFCDIVACSTDEILLRNDDELELFPMQFAHYLTGTDR